MSIYIDMPQEVIDQMELNEEETVANGGAALAAYSKLQFCDTELTDALRKALLCYCELDTLGAIVLFGQITKKGQSLHQQLAISQYLQRHQVGSC